MWSIDSTLSFITERQFEGIPHPPPPPNMLWLTVSITVINPWLAINLINNNKFEQTEQPGCILCKHHAEDHAKGAKVPLSTPKIFVIAYIGCSVAEHKPLHYNTALIFWFDLKLNCSYYCFFFFFVVSQNLFWTEASISSWNGFWWEYSTDWSCCRVWDSI